MRGSTTAPANASTPARSSPRRPRRHGRDGPARPARRLYTATYRVISADSHPVSGGFIFTVGDPAPGRRGRSTSCSTRRGGPSPAAFDVARGRHRTRRLALRSAAWSSCSASWRRRLRPAGASARRGRRRRAVASPCARRVLIGAAVAGVLSGLGRDRPPGCDRRRDELLATALARASCGEVSGLGSAASGPPPGRLGCCRRSVIPALGLRFRTPRARRARGHRAAALDPPRRPDARRRPRARARFRCPSRRWADTPASASRAGR